MTEKDCVVMSEHLAVVLISSTEPHHLVLIVFEHTGNRSWQSLLANVG